VKISRAKITEELLEELQVEEGTGERKLDRGGGLEKVGCHTKRAAT
jgi:hypothetical protein